jgi:hypothetical protein
VGSRDRIRNARPTAILREGGATEDAAGGVGDVSRQVEGGWEAGVELIDQEREEIADEGHGGGGGGVMGCKECGRWVCFFRYPS